MSSKFSYAFAFSVGAAVGAVVSWKILKTKYERIADEEIASVVERFRNKKPNTEVKDKDISKLNKDEKKDHCKLVSELGYSSLSEEKEEKGGVEPVKYVGPYVIEPGEFGEKDGYECVSLTYYADGVIANDYDEILGDVDVTVGVDSLSHFGEYEDDSVFVRNDEMKTDFEILRDYRKYSDVAQTVEPSQTEE